MTDKRKCYLYLYQSSILQGAQHTLQIKQQVCEAYAETIGWEIQDIITDQGVCESVLERDGLSRLLNTLASLGDPRDEPERPIVLLDAVSQIGRDPRVCLTVYKAMKDAGADVAVRGHTFESKVVFENFLFVMASQAEWVDELGKSEAHAEQTV